MDAKTLQNTFTKVLEQHFLLIKGIRELEEIEDTLIDQISEMNLILTGEKSTYDKALKDFDLSVLKDILVDYAKKGDLNG